MSAIAEKFRARAAAVGSLVCVGLDPEWEKIPRRFREMEFPQFEMNRWVIDETAEYAAAFKPNVAFYEARGTAGLDELEKTTRYVRETCPEIVTICDAKRADIGNTNRGYAEAAFDWLGCDAVTLHPYLGREALGPFLARGEKACIVLCRTSNAGAGEFQDLDVGGKALWEVVAEKVSGEWNALGNCMLVVGATYPEEMRRVREIAPAMTLLVPGVGAQGGDVRAVVEAGMDAEGMGLMIASSRGILFADDPAAAARALRDEINAARAGVYAAR
jgi:orotidine-5'-phosphate decarboxylase